MADGDGDRGNIEPQQVDRHRLIGVLGFLALVTIYVLTSPGNHSEADDAFWYAWDVEEAPWQALFHPFHLLYLPLSRIAWRALQLVGGPERAFPAMVFLGAVYAAGAVVVCWDLLVRRLDFRSLTAGLACGLLAFSYGIWRYAGEVEVYALSLLASAIMAHLALARQPRRREVVTLVLVSAVAPFIHILAVAGSAVAVPLTVVVRRGWRPGVRITAAIAVLGVAFSVMGYIAAGRPAEDLVGFYRSGERVWTVNGMADAARHGLAASQVVVSGNFVLAYEPVRDAIARWLPGRMLEDETYAGARAPVVVRFLAPVTLVLLGASLIWFLVAGRRPERSPARHAALIFGLAWLFLHIVLGVAFSRAGQPEVWMLGVLPAWLAFVAYFVDAADPPASLVAFVVTLAAHNAIGGLLVYSSDEGDRSRAKAAWLVGETSASDVIITAESALFARYLEYWAPARVLNLQFLDPPEMRGEYRNAVETGARVFATGDIFDLPPHYRVMRPALADSLTAFLAEERDRFVLQVGDEFGGVYRYARRDSAQDGEP